MNLWGADLHREELPSRDVPRRGSVLAVVSAEAFALLGSAIGAAAGRLVWGRARRRPLLCFAALAIVAVCLLASYWPRAISPATYRQIRAGMSRQEVEALVGLPPGSYYVGPEGVGGLTSQGAYGIGSEQGGLHPEDVPDSWRRQRDLGADAGVVLQWWGNRYAIDVAFDESGKAASWSLYEVFVVIERTTGQRVRMWLNP